MTSKICVSNVKHQILTIFGEIVYLSFLRHGHAFKTQCAVSVTLTFDLLRTNCFSELTMTPICVKDLDLDLYQCGEWGDFQIQIPNLNVCQY